MERVKLIQVYPRPPVPSDFPVLLFTDSNHITQTDLINAYQFADLMLLYLSIIQSKDQIFTENWELFRIIILYEERS
jgi:hypothetical protein